MPISDFPTEFSPQRWVFWLLGGWFFARIAVPPTSRAVAQKICLGGFAIMFAFVITAAVVGWGGR